MNKTLKVIEINEAIELAKKGIKVFCMTISDKPVVKNFKNLMIGDAFGKENDYIFFMFEEVSDENERTEN